MKIIYLHQYFFTPSMQGTTSTRSFEMARRLVKYGHEVHMVTSWRDETEEKTWFETTEEGIHVHWLPVPYHNVMSYRQRLSAFFVFAIKAAKKAVSLSGEIVFATSTPLTIAIPAVYASKRLKVPMVFEVRDLWPEMPIAIGALKNPILKWAAKRLELFAYKNATRVVALSPGMLEGVASSGYPRNRIHQISNSCDFDKFTPDPESRNRFIKMHPEIGEGFYVLYGGTLGKVNDVVYLVMVAKESLKLNPNIKYVVIGDGSEFEETKKLAVQLGVDQVNYFQYPRIPKIEVIDTFLAADIVTSLFANIPEMEKNSANKFFDGLAAGKPIAINYGGWQADLLNETGAGLVLNRDPETAAKQLAEFLADPGKVEAAGKAARKLAEERFSRDKLAKQLEEVLVAAVEDSKQ
ncbi:MAG: glycosyltransferase family 4 protein [Verrucomicrobia bacterium]|nr:glycosyltransferase family 4 protein [Verrucomicrobiota bacterium]